MFERVEIGFTADFHPLKHEYDELKNWRVSVGGGGGTKSFFWLIDYIRVIQLID